MPAPIDAETLTTIGPSRVMRWGGCGPKVFFKQRADLTFAELSPEVELWTGVPVSDWRENAGGFLKAVEDGEPLVAYLRGERTIPRFLVSTFEFRHAQTGRITRVCEDRVTDFDANGAVAGYEGVWEDITVDYAADERRLQSAWRESLSTLMVASLHDFCNIATALVGLAQSAESTPDLESLRSGLSSVRTAALGASQVAHRLQRWHARLHGEKTFVDLNDTVRSMTDILRKVLPRRIRVETELAEGSLPIEVDPSGLERAMVVFALNAADAMPGGGLVTLRTRAWDTAPKVGNLFAALPPPPLISLSVADTGSGMAPSAFYSLYAPGYTTKPLGKGAGRGLYSVLLFVEKHGAALSIDTGSGCGTTLNLWFARANLDTALATEIQQPRPSLLVARGESCVRKSLAEHLQESGFYAEAVDDELKALDLLCSPHYRFDGAIVLAADADESTLAFCRDARARNPRVRVLIGIESQEPDQPGHTTATADGWPVLAFGSPNFIEHLKATLDTK